NGSTVTGTTTLQSGITGVGSGQTATFNKVVMSGTATTSILRVAGNSADSTVTIGVGGITASGGEIQVKFNTSASNATLNLGGDFTATGNVNFTNGGYTGSTALNLIKLNGTRTFEIGSTFTTTVAPDIAGTNAGDGLTKTGAGTLVFNTTMVGSYTGATTVSAGTLLINGSLGNTNVSVDSSATIGGSGDIGGSLSFADGAKLTVNLADPLSVSGLVNFANFGFDDLNGFDVETAALGTYTLLAGSNFDFTNVEHFGLANAFTRGDGAQAYFESGSLAVTIAAAVPEPSVILLGSLGFLALARRRN
ncbi:MAG: autotransporter-associated beta strand repeat-containing protein, partial [Luteolibacter sp.]